MNRRRIVGTLSAVLIVMAASFGALFASVAFANPPAQSGERYGLVSGDIEDGGFNQLAWKGMQDAVDELNIQVEHVESDSSSAAHNMARLTGEGYRGIVAVGYGLSDAVRVQSQANPDVAFIIVDAPSRSAGSVGLLFDVDEPSFMAGYLAAGMSASGTVCAYGGEQTPPVLAFLVGFESGVTYYNARNVTEVELIGWKTDAANPLGGEGIFAGGFTVRQAVKAQAISADFLAQGCDVIFPVAGALATVTAEFAQAHGMMVIGVDADQTVTEPQLAEVYLTSVTKKIDVAVLEALRGVRAGAFRGGTNHIGTLANGEVGLAPFHSFDSSVPKKLKDDLVAIESRLIAGDMVTGWPIYAAAATLRLDGQTLGNATYPVEYTMDGSARLSGGTYEEPIAGSSAKVQIRMSDLFAFGDLDGDGIQDAAVVLVSQTGGTGTFYDLFAVLDRNSRPFPVASVPLGDRIELKGVSIEDGRIVVDMVTQGADDAMSNPTQPVTKRYQVQTQLAPSQEGAEN